MDRRYELLAAINAADLDIENPDAATHAALERGREMGLSDTETYLLLERLWDDRYIVRREPTRTGSGRIHYYHVERITQLGVDVAEQYLRMRSEKPRD